MRSLWIAWMPLLFLPNLGLGGVTRFGSLELSDFLIGPYLVLVSLARGPRHLLLIGGLIPLMLGFAGWTLLSTLLIRERYGYVQHTEVLVGFLKLGKLSLYATAAVLTARALADETQRRRFPWALTAAGIIVAVSLITVHDTLDSFHPERAPSGYKAENAISVMMAVILCYLGSLFACGGGTRRWRDLALPALALMVPGFLLSHGRGGWFAALAGGAYFFYRRGIGTRLLIGMSGCGGLILATYSLVPVFREELDRTIWPDQQYLAQYKAGVGGFDDGARLTTWAHELAGFAKSPLLGTGFYHRGGSSGLWETGSHNFFLQMFLEAGLVGGALVIAMFWRMWKLAGAPLAVNDFQEVPVRSALVAAVLGGLTGEYFYGGMVLFTLLVVFAPVGGLPACESTTMPSRPILDDPRIPPDGDHP